MSSRMSELALAVFASETGTHLVRPPRGERWRAFGSRFDERAYLERLTADGYRFLPRAASDFPPLLRAIHDPPAGLFLRGAEEPAVLSRPAVAVVGARASSGYGASVARSLGRELAAAGLVVVSGLARGIDAEAHRGARDAGGATVAVLGCGIDRDYPASHAELARRVAAGGLIVSEYAPGVEPAPWRFPARNRIVAGLCAVTVVVEARERGGALITAALALEEGCAAARRLAEGGLRVRVHDARGLAEGARWRNGGFARRGGSARYDVARETYGADQAKAYWLWTEEKLDRLAALAGDVLRRPGSYRLAADVEERDAIRLVHGALHEAGVAAERLVTA